MLSWQDIHVYICPYCVTKSKEANLSMALRNLSGYYIHFRPHKLIQGHCVRAATLFYDISEFKFMFVYFFFFLFSLLLFFIFSFFNFSSFLFFFLQFLFIASFFIPLGKNFKQEFWATNWKVIFWIHGTKLSSAINHSFWFVLILQNTTGKVGYWLHWDRIRVLTFRFENLSSYSKMKQWVSWILMSYCIKYVFSHILCKF